MAPKTKVGASSAIFFQLSSKRDAPPKRGFVPGSILNLKQTAARLLKIEDFNTIVGITAEDGTKITKIGDVTPGMTLFIELSTDDDGFAPIRTKELKPPPPPKDARITAKGSTALSIISDEMGEEPKSVSEYRQQLSNTKLSARLTSMEEFLRESEEEEEIPPKTARDRLLDKKVDTDKVTGMLAPVISVGDEELETILNDVPTPVAQFVSSSEEVQVKQQRDAVDKMESFIGGAPSFRDSVNQYIQSFVDDRTYTSGTGAVYTTHVALVGPRGSGKSVILKQIANKSYQRLISTGQSKQTFFFFLDLLEGEDKLKKGLNLYDLVIENIFAQLANQQIALRADVPQLVTYFKKLARLETLQPIPPQFAGQEGRKLTVAELGRVAKMIHDQKNAPASQWLRLVFALIEFIPRAFGLHSLFVIFDHFDVADTDCTHEGKIANPTTALKQLLCRSHFVVSCQDENRLLELLSVTEVSEIDLLDRAEVVSIVGSDDNDNLDPYVYLDLEIDGEPKPFRFGMENCGGCCAYLEEWNVIADIARKVDEEQKGGAESINSANLLTKIRAFIPKVVDFVDEDQFDSGNHRKVFVRSYKIVIDTPDAYPEY